MTEDVVITTHTVDGEALAPIIADIEEVLGGYSRDHIILALLCMALLISDPGLTQDQLKDNVRELSRYICLLLSPTTKQEDAN